jgi:pimeloyl-ACP methyl ester carboxylesterase
MAEIIARGVRFHVQQLAPRQRPSQPKHPVVFIHGLGVDNLSSFYYTLANPVAHAGAEVILYDLRGHGLSERPPTGYRVSDSIADLAAILDTLGVDGPVHLVGNSYGGTIALGFAVGYPERVASMVLIEAHVPVPGWPAQMAATIRNYGSDLAKSDSGRWMWIAQEGRKLARRSLLEKALIHHTTLITDVQATEPLAERALRALTCPVHAVYGEHSDILHHAHVLDDLLSLYTLTVLPNLNHSVLPKATRVLRAIVLEWFAAEATTPQAGFR